MRKTRMQEITCCVVSPEKGAFALHMRGRSNIHSGNPKEINNIWTTGVSQSYYQNRLDTFNK